MIRLITYDDFVDVYQKLVQRGLGFIFSKLNSNRIERTKSAFDDSSFSNSNWWIIPEVRRRWNKKITGNESKIYEDYLVENYLQDRSDIKMLSIGSGVCSHEIELAKYSKFQEIICLDIANNLLEKAKLKAQTKKVNNISFICEDIRKTSFKENSFDIVFFHASLHHFDNVEKLINDSVIPWLKNDGLVVINEYVGPNRLQFPRNQINAINRSLKILPKHLRRRYRTNILKTKFYGSGYLRMIIADPSECIDSANILPTLRNGMIKIDEKPYGGNILMNVLKDISHNFIQTNKSDKQFLDKLFEEEDLYLKQNQSDFVFAIYKKKNTSKKST